MVPDADFVQHAIEKPGGDTRGSERCAERRVLDAIRARRPADDQVRIERAIQKELPLRPLVSRRRMIPDAIRDRRRPAIG